MRQRTFYRKFSSAVSESPASYLKKVRLSRARELLQAGMPLKQITRLVSYRSETAFRTAFAAKLETTPSEFQALHTGNVVRHTGHSTAPPPPRPGLRMRCYS